MSLALTTSARLKPDIRLAMAISHFEADLTGKQKALFRTEKSVAHSKPPEPSDVMKLTAMIDQKASGSQRDIRVRCVGPRLTNFLQAAQQYVALGDVVVGGSQNLIACGMWTVLRSAFLMMANYAAYIEKLSLLFMHAGRTAPRYQAMALLYPRSKFLQGCLCEYFIVSVQICHRVLKFSQKSYIGQLSSSLSDADVKQYQADLDAWAASIKDEVNLIMGQRIEDEARENSIMRAITNKSSELTTHRRKVKDRLRVLDACSTHDYHTPWKQARKIGNSSLMVSTSLYREWKASKSSCTIICTGKLGSGKTVLLANIVDNLHLDTETQSLPIAYYFCRHDVAESLQPRTIIGSLVRQLLSTLPEIPFLPLKVQDESVMDLDDLLGYFTDSFSPNSNYYFVLDGIDECSEITALSLKQFASPRVYKIPENNLDIPAFIDSELQARIAEEKLNIRDPTIVLGIRDALVKGAQGMFLWVSLQISSLCEEKSDEDIRACLKDLPKTLSETFSRILQRASSHSKSYQQPILELVAVALRPLTTDELTEALAVTPCDTTWNPSKLVNNIYATLACCGGLITVDEEGSTIHLVHHSVKRFLIGNFNSGAEATLDLEDANRRMGRIILTYLKYNIFETQLSRSVVPYIEGEAATKRIINSVSNPSKLVALKLLKARIKGEPEPYSDFNLGKAIASHNKSPGRQGLGEIHAFYSYAKYSWLFHTNSISEDDAFSSHALLGLLGQELPISPSSPWNTEAFNVPSFVVTGALNETQGIPVKIVEIERKTFWALRNSHLPLLRYLIRTRNSIKTTTSIILGCSFLLGSSPNGVPKWHKEMCEALFPFAVLMQFSTMVAFLLDHGASITYRDYWAVKEALSYGNISLLRVLFARFKSPSEIRSTFNSWKDDPILVAICNKKPEVASFLVSRGLNPTRAAGPYSPLYYLLRDLSLGPSFQKAFKGLSRAGAMLKYPNPPFETIELLLGLLKNGWPPPIFQDALRALPLDKIGELILGCCLVEGYDIAHRAIYLHVNAEVQESNPMLKEIHEIWKPAIHTKQSDVLRPFIRYGFISRDFLGRQIDNLGILHRRVEEANFEQIDFLCDEAKANINGILKGSNGTPKYLTPLLTAIMSCDISGADPFLAGMHLILKGADLNPLSVPWTNMKPPLEAIIEMVAGDPKQPLFNKNSKSLVRLAHTVVAFGANISDHVVEVVVSLSLSLLSPALGCSEIDSREVDSRHRHSSGIFNALLGLPNPNGDDLSESLLSLLESLLSSMMARKPRSTKLVLSIVGLISSKQQDWNYFDYPCDSGLAPSHNTIGHIIRILTYMVGPKAPYLSKEVMKPDATLTEPSISSSFPSMWLIEGMENGVAFSEHVARIVSSFTIAYLGKTLRKPVSVYVSAYPLLKYGRNFHQAVANICSDMSEQTWNSHIESGIREAMSSYDVESAWQNHHRLPQEGVYHELEAPITRSSLRRATGTYN